MWYIAIRMLTGDRAKYLGILFGVSFAALLMSQQAAIFCGLMLNTASAVRDASGADVWVMSPASRYVDDIRPISDNDLLRVRGVAGVRWAVPLIKGQYQAKTEDARFEAIVLIGVDNDAMLGVPREMVVGSLDDLRRPDAVVLDTYGFRYLFPGREPQAGVTLEMNDRRAVVVGVCRSSPPFMTLPLVYTRYSNALTFLPPQRRMMSYVLARATDGTTAGDLAAGIESATGLRARTSDEFAWDTIDYYLSRTGIPVNFGITILLGFVVGCAICGQTFYLFVLENTRHFGMLKAMGVGNLRLTGMVLLQAMLVGLVGFGIGLGMAVMAGKAMNAAVKEVPPVFYMPWQVPAMTAGAVLLIVTVAGMLSLRRVLRLEPATVFK